VHTAGSYIAPNCHLRRVHSGPGSSVPFRRIGGDLSAMSLPTPPLRNSFNGEQPTSYMSLHPVEDTGVSTPARRGRSCACISPAERSASVRSERSAGRPVVSKRSALARAVRWRRQCLDLLENGQRKCCHQSRKPTSALLFPSAPSLLTAISFQDRSRTTNLHSWTTEFTGQPSREQRYRQESVAVAAHPVTFERKIDPNK
jgi:hypothetical protein